MYAVVETGGKQSIVSPGQTLKVEKLVGEVGDEVELDHVLMIRQDDDVELGQPYLGGKKVKAKIVSHGKGDKIEILKFKRRKNFLKRQGHRQPFTTIEVVSIG